MSKEDKMKSGAAKPITLSVVITMATTGVLFAVSVLFTPAAATAQTAVTPAEARATAKEAYIYGVPLLDQYRSIFALAIARGNPAYMGPFNTILNVARVYTPDDEAFVSPNADTPYTFAAMDVRTEPLVLSVPMVDQDRYYAFQFMDLYTYNFAYIGSRTTGDEPGNFLITGPGWKGETPKGIKKVISAETFLVSGVGRTQLFQPADIENVKTIQAGYKLQPLSRYLGKPAPQAAPPVQWAKPLMPEEERKNPEFFNVLSFVLQFCPTPAVEKELGARFARIGIVPGKPFDVASLSPEVKQAFVEGMADGQKEIDARRAELIAKHAPLWGTRESQQNDYVVRAVAAQVALGANSAEEAIYDIYQKDASGNALDGSKNKYTVHFAKGQEPPVNAFWSLTMYDLPGQFLVKNPINRYLINSPMLPDLKRDPDGGLTLYVQAQSPGKDQESNWLPAPQGPFMMALRLYSPKSQAVDGGWRPPDVQSSK